MSAADFLLSPGVQKLLTVLYAHPGQQFSPLELAKTCKLDTDELEGTLGHLLSSGVLTKCKPAEGQAEQVTANVSFVFYQELRTIALKSFAAAEPLRAMLRSKFKESVLRAFILGEAGAAGTLELLIVHGKVAPDQAALAAALQKVVKAISRQLQVHVLSHGEFRGLGPRDALTRKLASKSSFEIVALGDTKAEVPTERVSLLRRATKRLASLAA
ncbi:MULTISPECIES: hypothetical protein [unclassified Variovorax]|uniref:hypothetical protein n=1 Tax=unclassified Variovorax TaxID=663243 RepID=UPI00076D5C21|nr:MULTISPECIES: hypothetical protein [unclassified Variovorax]KWT98099.1 hypothetical protein APY03_0770 [Variovorax sp. WDL1]PNG50425.1 hypothetical protein CHC06_06049 [Variovorax sp. B2]PNG51298.1 hypothetical protein CHC07_05955 [Variovorax sp. B4]VTV17555.1 hypothetical protein WDL1P1_00481 [Variovorax sp. WDL1]